MSVAVQYSADWSDEDVDRYVDFCHALAIDDVSVPMSVWMHESGCRTTAHNPSGDASGICQFMPATLHGLGWRASDTHLAEFRQLGVSDQLGWCLRYYALHKGRIATVGRFYLCTFLPVLVDHGDSPAFVVSAPQGPFGWAYAANKGFDVDNRGWITVGDLVDAAEKDAGSPRGQELIARARQAASPPPTEPPDDIYVEEAPEPITKS